MRVCSALRTRRSRAFPNLMGMELIILAILGGQILIVQFGGAVFRTVPLDFMTWMTIVVSTSFVLWIGELVRLIRRLTQK